MGRYTLRTPASNRDGWHWCTVVYRVIVSTCAPDPAAAQESCATNPKCDSEAMKMKSASYERDHAGSPVHIEFHLHTPWWYVRNVRTHHKICFPTLPVEVRVNLTAIVRFLQVAPGFETFKACRPYAYLSFSTPTSPHASDQSFARTMLRGEI